MQARDAEASELQRKIQDLVGQLEVLKVHVIGYF